MQKFIEKKFDLPKLKGISEKTNEEHLKLYAGYVKNTNLILEKMEELGADSEKNSYLLGELQRRFGFEFDGMRNHEYYFSSFEDGAKALSKSDALYSAIENEWNSFDAWLLRFKAISMTRGIGWAVLYYDVQNKKLFNAWVDEQHLGHLTGLSPILMMDMWEHSYVADYLPSGKKNYIEDFFANINWEKISKNFSDLI
ncbi:MAG: Fe-Mn family superoxide dismutase [Candidatus Taylorbacteria bacterium]|nr:Fe-Mn family superoxide dismutase [Candidatus Taylorbacteria bacterium]